MVRCAGLPAPPEIRSARSRARATPAQSFPVAHWIAYSQHPPRFSTKQPKDLLHPSAADEARIHKKKRLVQGPNSFFMDVKCPGCFNMYVPPTSPAAPSIVPWHACRLPPHLPQARNAGA